MSEQKNNQLEPSEKNSKEKEQQRIEANYQIRRQELLAEGYREVLVTTTVFKANIYALLLAAPIVALYILVFMLRWQGAPELAVDRSFVPTVILLFISVPVHEVLHGIGWWPFCKNGWQSIFISMMKSSLTPFCHCLETLSAGAYAVGTALPCLVLSGGSFILSLIFPNIQILMFAIMSAILAGGDLWILVMLPRHRRGKIIDHPTEIGFASFEK